MTPSLSLFARTAIVLSAAAAFMGCPPQFNDQVCEQDQDCFPDEICQASMCVSRDDVPDVDPDAELNACGGIQELDNAPGDPCGPCDLDQFECQGAELVCDGETACPETDVITTTPTSITADGAQFNGQLTELPLSGLTELGFCWSNTEANPTLDNANCTAIDDVLEAPGDFSIVVQGLFPGTSYNVSTYFIDGDSESGYGNTIDFITLAPAPTNLAATVAGDAITLTWDEAEDALEYEVLRDGESIATLTELTYTDDEAPAGTLSGYEDLSATQGTETDGVLLSWSQAVGAAGAEVEYTIVASYPDAESDPSDAVSAQRDAPIPTSYEVQIDDGAWIDVGLVTDYLDEDAPEGEITAGTVEVTAGVHANRVELSISGSTTNDGAPREYRVRALATDLSGAPSPAASGFRGVGELTYQWQRTTSDEDVEGDYQNISGATSALHTDFDAPANGETRFYRVILSAAGAPSVTTPGQAGYRAFGAQVTLVDITGVGISAATINANITGLGDPAATEHGICISTSAGVSFPASGATECVALGAPAATGTFSETFTDLTPGTTYFVRAFIQNATGISYSGEQSFDTDPAIPEPPTNLTASTTNPDLVALTWTPVSGAEGYRVYRDGVEIEEIDGGTQSAFDDTTATEGSLGAPTSLSASTDNSDQVNLSWTAASTTAGDSAVYTVRAFNVSGESADSNTATGSRAAPAVTGYEISRDGTSIDTIGASTSYADTGAEAGTAAAPTGLTASTDDAAQINLSWTAATGSAGESASYTVRALSDIGPSTESNAVTGSRAAPEITGYEIFRDGSSIDTIGVTTSYADTNTAAGTADAPTDLTVSSNDVDQVNLSWTAASASAGDSASYTVAAITDAGNTDESSAVTGSRAAPEITGYEIFRDGSSIDTIGLSTSYADTTAPAGSVAAPTDLTASTDDVAQINLTWTAATATAGDDASYTVEAITDAGNTPESGAATGSRAAPSITGYELFRDGSSVDTLGLVTSYADADAPAGSIAAPGAVSASTDNADQVNLSWTAPAATAGTSVTYTLSALSGAGASSLSNEVTGSRDAPAITGYEIYNADTDALLSTEATAGTVALSADAPAYNNNGIDGTYDIPNLDVDLTITDGAGVDGADLNLYVVAIGEAGINSPDSSPVTGYRPASPLSYAWERSEGSGDPIAWEDFGAADAPSVTDENPDPTKSTYRVTVTIGTSVTVEVPSTTVTGIP